MSACLIDSISSRTLRLGNSGAEGGTSLRLQTCSVRDTQPLPFSPSRRMTSQDCCSGYRSVNQEPTRRQGRVVQTERSQKGSSRSHFGRAGNRPEHLEAAIKERLAVLADIEARFENECLGLDRSVVPRAMKAFFIGQMHVRRRLRRLPHEIALKDLHQKLLRLARFHNRTLH